MENVSKSIQDLLKKVAVEEKYENCKIGVNQIYTGGANYSSYLYKATISAPGKEDLKLFVKTVGIGGAMREFVSQSYQIEIYFLNNLLHVYQNLENKHNIPDEHRLNKIKLYASSNEPFNETLIFEDLEAKKFKSFDRFKCVTWEQTTASIEQLAKFHALSFALSKQSPEEFEAVKQDISFLNNENVYRCFINDMSATIIKAVEEKDKERIASFIQDVLESKKFYYLVKPIRKEVIIHGDFRPSNLMYRMENGACQAIPLDFQVLHCGTPVYDLMYFIDLGVDDEFRTKYFQKTLDHYYSELRAALGRLNVDPDSAYSREDFEYEYKEILPFTVVIGLCALHVLTLSEDSAPKELENLEFKGMASIPNEQYVTRLRGFVKFYTDLGIIP